MPTIRFTCETCGWGYKLLTFGDDMPKPHCPKCKSVQAKPLPQSKRLFGGLVHVSPLAKDTN